jgi:hypothetical protein
MTVYSDLRSALVTIMEAITDVGQVHNRPRYNADMSRFLEHFKSTVDGVPQIRGWMLLREAAPLARERDVFGEVARLQGFVWVGVQSLIDGSDSYGAFQALCDTVMAAFDDETTLGVSGVVVDAVGPCALRSFEEQQLGSVLCHVAEIEVPVWVSRAVGTA